MNAPDIIENMGVDLGSGESRRGRDGHADCRNR